MAEVEYRAFMLRLWWDDVSAGPRASITNVHDGRVWVFANLDELCRWILEFPENRPTIRQRSAGAERRDHGFENS